jgi:hypothetical protein
MDFIKNIRNKTAKLRSLGKRLFTRRSIGRIAPSHVQELAALDPTAPSLSPTTKVVTHIQKSFRKRKNTRQAIADLSKRLATRRIQIADLSKRLATRRIQKKFRSALPKVDTCPICLGAMLNPRHTKTLRCGHKFHRECIDQWNTTNPTCPSCRTSIAPERPYHLQRSISMPISNNINNTNTVNRVNALIAGLANAATMIEAIGLIHETDLLIDSLPESEQAVLREARTQVWLQTYQRLQEIRATIDRANALIDNMRYATTFDEATWFMNASSIVINSFPRNGNTYRQLANRQWATWLQVYPRVSAPIQSRAVNPSITVNGITSEEYENLIHGR